MQRLGVIDLGTNTFHLLIVETDSNNGFKELYRERRFIKLAEEGIETIGGPAYQRGLGALIDYKKELDRFGVQQFKAFGTAAMRTASNGPDFINEVQEKAGIGIELISGTEEARLIHIGVSRAVPFDQNRVLIMDIGGGSVEFIIADHSKVYWARSFPIGVALLFREFHQHDPITPNEIQTIHSFLMKELAPLQKALAEFPTVSLVGASGTFDVLEHMLAGQVEGRLHVRLNADGVFPLAERLITMPLKERIQQEGMPAARADMVVVALILVRTVLQLADIHEVIVSAYAMKEGILTEMIQTDSSL
jgi:exopolyphosphatase/guanosine-5'-triphosphate,3'-diphosphate pyrophosphatase